MTTRAKDGRVTYRLSKTEAATLCNRYLARMTTVEKRPSPRNPDECLEPKNPIHAMLLQAVDGAVREVYSRDPDVRREAWRFFDSDENWVIDMLGIPPSVAREAIDRMLRHTRKEDLPDATPATP
jgi:hypothetical protein